MMNRRKLIRYCKQEAKEHRRYSEIDYEYKKYHIGAYKAYEDILRLLEKLPLDKPKI